MNFSEAKKSELKIEQQRIQKWNGEMPKVNAGGTNLLIDPSKY